MQNDTGRLAWIVGAIVVLAAMVVTVVVLLESEGRDSTVVAAMLIGFIGPTIVAMLALLKGLDTDVKVSRQKAVTDSTHSAVAELANGSMDAKIRAAVAEVLPDTMVDPAIRPQLAVDRQRRDDLAHWVEAELQARLREGEQ